MFYEGLIRPLLYQLEPERAHHLSTACLKNRFFRGLIMAGCRLPKSSLLETELCGLRLPHPIGLAAGFDKNGEWVSHLPDLGFSYLEIGTVTAHAQSGNPRPRLFRLSRDRALINRMGFNNQGAEAVARNLETRRGTLPLGVNIGKSKLTPMEEAVSDYERSFHCLKPFADYFVINVSSPNTPNLRALQEREPLRALLGHLMSLNKAPRLPVFLKIAPDLNEYQIADIAGVVWETEIHGVIATNTTVARSGLRTSAARVDRMGPGGLSGQPLRETATAMIKLLRKHLPKKVQIIGVGGIFSGAHAFEKIKAGASGLQLYTSFIYRGPHTVFKILDELVVLMEREGYTSLRDAVGAETA